MTAEHAGGRPRPATDIAAAFTPPIGFTPDALAEAREQKALRGQTIIVFGASPTGIGGAAAYEAALQGANVITVSRKREDNSEAEGFVVSLAEQTGVQAKWIPADITKPGAAAGVIRDVVREFGKVDAVVIASGERDDFPFIAMSDERMRRIMEANFFGPYFAMQAAFNQMRRQKPPHGRIVVIGSEASKGSPGQTNYAASKGALASAVASIELEMKTMYRPKNPDLDIAVVNISPGVARTGFVKDVTPEQRAYLYKLSGADRDIEPSEVGELVIFAASPQGAELSGQTVSIVGKGPAPQDLLPNKHIEG